jgi:hypothetical protein
MVGLKLDARFLPKRFNESSTFLSRYISTYGVNVPVFRLATVYYAVCIVLVE